MKHGNGFIDIKGKTFGSRRVVKFLGRKKDHLYWLCACRCGKKERVAGYSLQQGRSTQCRSCYIRSRSIPMIGKRFGTWKVLRLDKSRKSREHSFICQCKCGLKLGIGGYDLRAGRRGKTCRHCAYGTTQRGYPELRNIDPRLRSGFLKTLRDVRHRKTAVVTYSNLKERFELWSEAKKEKEKLQQLLRRMV